MGTTVGAAGDGSGGGKALGNARHEQFLVTHKAPRRPMRHRLRTKVVLFMSIVVLVVLLAVTLRTVMPASDSVTESYVARLDPAFFESQGVDYRLKDIDDGEFHAARIREIESELRGINRPVALEMLFDLVTAEARTDTERHLQILRFLHKASYHPPGRQPLYPDGTMVMDPLVLLTLADMHCGQVARVAVDLFASKGYPGRVAQLGGHVVAEVYYDEDWHYLDGDVFGGGESVQLEDGRIPSVSELSEDPFAIDALYAHAEVLLNATDRRHISHARMGYPSYFYHSKHAYKGYGPMYYVKADASLENEQSVALFGWSDYETIEADATVLFDIAPRFQPSPPFITRVEVKGTLAHVDWHPSRDDDHDLRGYRVFLGSSSRGWNYRVFVGEDNAKQYWSAEGTWDSSLYDAAFNMPPDDFGIVETENTSLALELPAGASSVFLTIMPFDEHGEAVGKRLYPMSAELRLRPLFDSTRGTPR